MAEPRWTLLPPAPDHCQVCAVFHEPGDPHNPQSLYWVVKRGLENREPPTWEEALAHCTVEMRDYWVGMLEERGIVLDIDAIEALSEAD